jgi:hypothetical protein
VRKAWRLLEALSDFEGALRRLCADLDRFVPEADWESMKKPEVLVEFEQRLLVIVGDFSTSTRRHHGVIGGPCLPKALELVHDLSKDLNTMTNRVRQALRCLGAGDTEASSPTPEQMFNGRWGRSRLVSSTADEQPGIEAQVEVALKQASDAAGTSLKPLRKHLSVLGALRKEAETMVGNAEAALLSS